MPKKIKFPLTFFSIAAIALILVAAMRFSGHPRFSVPAAQVDGKGCQLIVFGHLYSLEPYPELMEILAKHVREKYPNASALISTGDATTHGTAEAWSNFFKVYKKFGQPIYFAPGNHDVRNPMSLENYMKYVGYTSKKVTINNCNLVLVNTVNHQELEFDDLEMMKGGGLDEESMALLAGLEQKKRNEANLLFIHHGLYSLGVNAWKDGLVNVNNEWDEGLRPLYRNEKVWREDVQPLIKGKIDAVYSGDWFNQKISRVVIDDIPYIGNSLGCDFDPGPIGNRRPLSYTVINVDSRGNISSEIDYLPVPITSDWFSYDRDVRYEDYADDFAAAPVIDESGE